MKKWREKKNISGRLLLLAVLVMLACCLIPYGGDPSPESGMADSCAFPAGAQGVTELYQTDPAWKDIPYGDETIGTAGCAPTVLAMALGQFSTVDLASWADENGFYEPGSGTQWAFVTAAAQAAGVLVQELGLDENLVSQALDAGCSVVLSVGPGTFTSTGHFLLVWARDQDHFWIRDPNSFQNTTRAWTWPELESQIRCLWAVGPLRGQV